MPGSNGISISQIRLFKACRRAWWLKYHEGLVPLVDADALRTGRGYHHYLEMMENGEKLPDGEFSKERAMAGAYGKHIFPSLDVKAAELPLSKDIGSYCLYGIVDGIAADGNIVEHKTTSRDVSEGGEYEYALLWDEQVPAYMSLVGSRKVYYTVCRKPTIRQKRGESEEEFYRRMVAWYDEDTESKIRLFTVERTDGEVEDFEKDFQSICAEMAEAANDPGKVYRNTCHCRAYGRWCEYASVCLHYDPEQKYIEFMLTKGD